MADFKTRFGALVQRKQEERGWSFAQLAFAAYGEDGNGGDTRKGDAQKVVAGTTKPNAATIKRYRVALDLTQEEIDACRTKAELELAHYADRLFAVIAEAATQAGVNEDLTAQITERYAAGNPNDFDAALKGLQRALDVAAKHPPKTNQPTEVDDIIAKVDRLNREEDLETGTAALKAALDEQRQKEAAEAQATGQLLTKAIEQAVLERNVEDAAGYTVEQLTREHADQAERQQALGLVTQSTWLARGRDQGLNFDLEVATALGGELLMMASTTKQQGEAFWVLSSTLATLGYKEKDTTRLEKAIVITEELIRDHAHEFDAVERALIQTNFGQVLSTLGTRRGEHALMERAVTALKEALCEVTREEMPYEWAVIQCKFAGIVRAMGELEHSSARLEEAVGIYRTALQELAPESVPRDWAGVQSELGAALHVLGEWENDAQRVEQAIAAYETALQEQAPDRFPLEWATSFANQGEALSLLAEWQSDAAMAVRAVKQIEEAEKLFRAVSHFPSADYCAEQLELAEARLAALEH